jgi:hypothetical protein
MRNAIAQRLSTVGRDLAPWTEVVKRTFEKDPSKDKTLQAAMKDAETMVKSGSHKQALEAYTKIYGQYKSMAAAVNASYLYEALGDTPAAAAILKDAYDATGNPKVKAKYDVVAKILQDAATLETAYSDKKSQSEKTANVASEEIRKVLKAGSKVLIYNTTPNNDKANLIVDEITAEFINSGIAVVDRDQLSAALIQEEQTTQMSGAVSDEDIVNIGNATGANTIIMLGVDGAGAMRRLRVKVLDVEKRVPILQSDASEKWQL